MNVDGEDPTEALAETALLVLPWFTGGRGIGEREGGVGGRD